MSTSKIMKQWMQGLGKAFRRCRKCSNANCKVRDDKGNSQSPAGCTVFDKVRVRSY